MIIHNIKEFCDYWGVDQDNLERSVYKNTSCGAWIHWDNQHIHIGSIVEGSDAEFDREFKFPFDSDDIDLWLDELEVLCEDAWNEANGSPYRIILNGYDQGIYYGIDEGDALNRLARDAGYKNWKESCEVCPISEDEVEIREVTEEE